MRTAFLLGLGLAVLLSCLSGNLPDPNSKFIFSFVLLMHVFWISLLNRFDDEPPRYLRF